MSGRLVDWTLVVLGLAGLAGVTWWALYGGPKSAENLQNELQIEAETALVDGGHSWASVRVEGQRAVVTGDSPSYDSVDAAIADVISSTGQGGLFFGGITQVTENVQAAKPVSPYVWSAKRTVDGPLILSGYVPSRQVLNGLLADAEAIAPGEVQNELQLGTGEPFGDWAETARKSLLFLDLLERGQIEFEDSRITLKGVAPTLQVRDTVVREFSAIEDPYKTTAEVRSAGRWRARHSDTGLLISGSVSSQSERNEINALANEYYSGRVLDDMVVMASDTEDWLVPLRSALPHFARFQSGELAFVPSDGGFYIEGQAADSSLTYLKQDLSEAETSWDIMLAVDEILPTVEEIDNVDLSRVDRAAACQYAFQSVLSDNKIVFEVGSAVISRDSGPTLDKLLTVARRCEGIQVQVQGHTDAYGNRAGNIRLSEQRAAAVVEYLESRGLPSQLFEPVGFGPDQPIASNDTADGRSANRRIEFRVLERG